MVQIPLFLRSVGKLVYWQRKSIFVKVLFDLVGFRCTPTVSLCDVLGLGCDVIGYRLLFEI